MNVPGARDMQLLERGWQHKEGAYALPGGEWLSRLDARIAAGLDTPPPAPELKRIDITMLDLGKNLIVFEGSGVKSFVTGIDTPTVKATLRMANGARAEFSAPLTTDEQSALGALLDTIAARLDRESRQ